MRIRALTAVAAASMLILAACGDDDEGAGGDTTIVAVGTAAAPAGADTTEAAAGAETTEAVAGAETTAAAAGAATTEAVAGAETTEAVAGAETTEAAAGAETTEAVAGAETTEAAAGAETTEGAVGVATTEAVGIASATTDAGAATTEAAAATTEAAVATTEAGAATTEAGADTTDAGVATTEASATSAPASVPETTSAPGSSAPADEPGSITVGSADFSESQLLAQIYGQALEAAGFDVSFELGIGSREVYLGAIEGGEVDIVPEYTGSLLGFLSTEQPDAGNVDEQLTALADVLPDGLEVLTPSSAEDKDTIVCSQEVVDELGLTDLSSLFENSAEITLAAPPEFEERSPFGLAGFTDIYEAEFAEFVPLPYGDIAVAISGGEVDCGNIFSTNPQIDTEGLVPLEDDLAIVPNEAVLPLVRSEVVTPELTATLDDINAALDTETLTALVAQVDIDDLGVDVVAADFLASLGGGAPATTG